MKTGASGMLERRFLWSKSCKRGRLIRLLQRELRLKKQMVPTAMDQLKWKEERRRYQLLRFVFDEVGRECRHDLSAPEIGTGLDLPPEDVVRILNWLVHHGYARRIGCQPDLCVTSKAIHYFEDGAERRRSLRD